MTKKNIINLALIISIIVFLGLAIWILLTANDAHSLTSYGNRKILLGISAGLALILSIVRNYYVHK